MGWINNRFRSAWLIICHFILILFRSIKVWCSYEETWIYETILVRYAFRKNQLSNNPYCVGLSFDYVSWYFNLTYLGYAGKFKYDAESDIHSVIPLVESLQWLYWLEKYITGWQKIPQCSNEFSPSRRVPNHLLRRNSKYSRYPVFVHPHHPDSGSIALIEILKLIS